MRKPSKQINPVGAWKPPMGPVSLPPGRTNGIFSDPLFKESLHTYGQHINYCKVVSRHQNTIVERMIK